MRLPVVMLAIASLFAGFAVVPEAAAKPKNTTGQTETKKKPKKSKKHQKQEEPPKSQ